MQNKCIIFPEHNVDGRADGVSNDSDKNYTILSIIRILWLPSGMTNIHSKTFLQQNPPVPNWGEGGVPANTGWSV